MNVLPIAFESESLRSIFPYLIPIAGIIGGCSIVIVAIYLHFRKQQLWHETARVAIEKGQPVPPMPMDDNSVQPTTGSPVEWEAVKRRQTINGLMIGGLVNFGVGLGLFLLLSRVSNNVGVGYVGAIPGFIGVALLISAFFMHKMAPRSDK